MPANATVQFFRNQLTYSSTGPTAQREMNGQVLGVSLTLRGARAIAASR